MNWMLRSLGIVPLAITSVAALGVSQTVTPTSASGGKTVRAEARLLDTESWIMGGSGLPIPPPSYMDAITERFIDPTTPFFNGQPQFPVSVMNALFTPEGLYPNSGVKSLELEPSTLQGLSILNSTINSQIADGNNLVVLGYSQSATISTLEMRDLLALPLAQQPTADQLSFVMLGDPNLPDGGLFERFDLPVFSSYPTIPSLGITFSGATPADVPWDTAIYTMEYDGYADFPRYPIDIFSDLNAVLGIEYVHTIYPDLTDAQLASAFQLPVTADYTGATQYFMIPNGQLPLLQPLESIPVVGQPIYDLMEPDMRVLVDLGYGSVTNGWDAGPANVPTPMGLFPTNLNPAEVLSALAGGTQEGVQKFISDLGSLASGGGGLASVADVSNVSAALTDGAAGAGHSLPSLIDVANTMSSIAESAYSTLLPTADVINTMLTSAPAYAATLAVDELASGNLLDAVGLPIAGLFGLGSIAGGLEFIVMFDAATQIAADLTSLIPF